MWSRRWGSTRTRQILSGRTSAPMDVRGPRVRSPSKRSSPQPSEAASRSTPAPGRSRDLPPVPLVAIGRGNRRAWANSSRRRTSPGLRPRRPWPRGCPSHPTGRRRSSQRRLHGTGASWPSRDGVALSQGAAPDDLPSCPWDRVDDDASTLLTSATTASRTNSRFSCMTPSRP